MSWCKIPRKGETHSIGSNPVVKDVGALKTHPELNIFPLLTQALVPLPRKTGRSGDVNLQGLNSIPAHASRNKEGTHKEGVGLQVIAALGGIIKPRAPHKKVLLIY
jgi:hypothetical protein